MDGLVPERRIQVRVAFSINNGPQMAPAVGSMNPHDLKRKGGQRPNDLKNKGKGGKRKGMSSETSSASFYPTIKMVLKRMAKIKSCPQILT
jgi:hypothetical protein